MRYGSCARSNCGTGRIERTWLLGLRRNMRMRHERIDNGRVRLVRDRDLWNGGHGVRSFDLGTWGMGRVGRDCVRRSLDVRHWAAGDSGDGAENASRQEGVEVVKGSDWVSLAIGAVVLYVLYEWMQGASQATGALTNTLQSSPAFQSAPPLQTTTPTGPVSTIAYPSPSACARYGGMVNASGACVLGTLANFGSPLGVSPEGLMAQ
jgi:hypothetical protein